LVVNDNSNHLVVKGGSMPVRSEIEVEASPEEVWDALVDEDRRVQWLGEEGRDVEIEEVCAPNRLVWWWSQDDRGSTRVEISLDAVARGTRIVVSESVPSFPLPSLAACVAAVLA